MTHCNDYRYIIISCHFRRSNIKKLQLGRCDFLNHQLNLFAKNDNFDSENGEIGCAIVGNVTNGDMHKVFIISEIIGVN